jgi:hypothetical protein
MKTLQIRFMLLVLEFIIHPNKSAHMSREWWDSVRQLSKDLKQEDGQ